MKLLRLTTNKSDGTFDARFNEDVYIPPNSSIALQSCALNTDQSEIIINGNNSLVRASIDGNVNTIFLTHGEYDENNFHKLLNDFTTKLNQSLSLTVSRERATEFLVSQEHDNYIHIQYRNTSYALTGAAGIADKFVEHNNGAMSITNTNNGQVRNAGAAVLDDSVRLNSDHHFTNGCGSFYTKLQGINNVAGNTFKLILTKKNPSLLGNSIVDADIIYSIGIECDGTGGITTQPYKVRVNNTNTTTGNNIGDAGAGADGDFFGFESDGTRMNGVLYKNGGVGRVELFGENIPVNDSSLSKDNYYASLIIRGANGDCVLSNIKFCESPYESNVLQTNEHIIDLGHDNPPTRPTTARIDLNIQFQRRDVPEYFGYSNVNLELLGLNNFDFIAETLFRPNVENDCFIVVMETMRLESFDSLIQGRKSILCSIPNDDHNKIVMYEPNTLIPIKLSNPNKMSIRNLRVKLFYQDYTEVLLDGLSVLTLLIM